MSTLSRSIKGLNDLIFSKNAWMRAAKNGDVATIESLLNRGMDVNIVDENKETALHWACYHGHVETVRLLLSRGANANLEALRRATSLHTAAENGNVELFRLLRSHKAKLEARDQEGRTCLHRAAELGHLEFCKEILLCIPSSTNGLLPSSAQEPLHVNTLTTKGNTALALAAANGHIEVVNLLLLAGADVQLARHNGWTPLHRSVEGNHIGVVHLLIEWGAAVNARNSVDTTPLHLAAQEADNEDDRMIELLLKAGADFNARQSSGKTPIQLTESDSARALLQRPPAVAIPCLSRLAIRALLRHHRYQELFSLPDYLLKNLGIDDIARPAV